MTGDHLYVIGTGNDNRAKIGRTRRTAKQRLRELQTGTPDTLRILAWYERLGHLEKRLHEFHEPYHVKLEWFDFRDNDPVHMVELALAFLGEVQPLLLARDLEWQAKLAELEASRVQEMESWRNLGLLIKTQPSPRGSASTAREMLEGIDQETLTQIVREAFQPA